jgi:hypothetical protein
MPEQLLGVLRTAKIPHPLCSNKKRREVRKWIKILCEILGYIDLRDYDVLLVCGL